MMLLQKKLWRLLACWMAVLLAAAATGCKLPPSEPEQTPAPVVISSPEPDVQPTAEPTPEPTPEPDESASEQFLALDREVFVHYVSDSGWALHEYLTDPAAFDIDASEIPMTWGDLSEEASHADVAECVTYLERLLEIDRERLTQQQQLSYDVLQQYFESNIAGDALEYYYEPLTQYTGLQVNLPVALWLFQIETEADVKAYLELVADTPRYLGQVLAYEQKRSENGRFMTEGALETILADLDQIIGAGDELFLISEFEKSLEGVSELTADQRAAYLEQGKALLTGEFLNAFQTLRDGLAALSDTCRNEEGLHAFGEEGLQYFTLGLQSEAASDISPEDAILLLEQEFAYLIYSYQTFSLEAEASEDPDTPLTSGDVRADLAELEALCKSVLPELPAHSYETRQVPPELEALMSPAAYAVPAIDDWQDNTVILNPAADQTYLFLTLAHEGYPGHMYQHIYQRNLDGLGLMQQVVPFSGYVEGWAQFAEELAILAQTKYNRTTTMMRFCDEMAGNAMLLAMTSIKVNYEGMEPDDLKEYLSTYGLGNDAIVSLLYSYAVNMPFYSFSYALGYTQLAGMMRSLSADLGEAYVQKDVLTQYLSYGPAYFNLLQERMDIWADEQVKNG